MKKLILITIIFIGFSSSLFAKSEQPISMDTVDRNHLMHKFDKTVLGDFSSNADTFISVNNIWNTETQSIQFPYNTKKSISHMQISENGKIGITYTWHAWYYGEIEIFNLKTGQLIDRLKGSNPQLSSDGKLLAYLDSENRKKLFYMM